jgi:hypothetical protein
MKTGKFSSWRRAGFLSLLLLTLIMLAPASVRALGSWQQITNAPPTTYPGLMLLLPDGSVMVQINGGVQWARLTPDKYGHYLNGNWSTYNSMHDSRTFYSSDVLQDGSVFVAGGEAGSGGSTAEIFNPQANGGAGSWTRINPPSSLFNTNPPNSAAFLDSDSILLSDGTVLVTAVEVGTNHWSLLYNPAANSWADALGDALNWQDEAVWVKLPDDSILTIDPLPNASVNTTERYIPSLKKWIADKETPRGYFSGDTEIGSAFMMADGRALFFGGNGHTVYYTPTGNTNLGSWKPGPDMPYYNGTITYFNAASQSFQPTNYNGFMVTQDTPSAMLNNGKILCQLSFDGFFAENIFYEYDPSVTNFVPARSPTSSTPGAPFFPASQKPADTYMLDLPDGTVIYNDSLNFYLYTPDGSPLPAGRPTIASLAWNPDGSLHLTGTLFNGISQGVSYNDDAQMDSNYPLVRFTDTGGDVYFGRTYNWSSTSVQTGGRIVTTECQLPAQVFNNGLASYSIQVVANGNASAPVPFYGPVWVDFNYAGTSQAGTFANPFSTLAKGTNAVASGGTILIKPGSSSENIKISKPMTISAVGGSAKIGH